MDNWLAKIPTWVWWAVGLGGILAAWTSVHLSKSGFSGFVILLPLAVAGGWIVAKLVRGLFTHVDARKQSKEAVLDLDEELRLLIERRGGPID